MGTFEVAFWTTHQLHEYGTGNPEYALEKFIRGTLKEINGSHDVTVKRGNKHPSAPHERVSGGGPWPDKAYDFCKNEYHEYDALLPWWVDWFNCSAEVSAKDANILVTDFDGTYGTTTGGCDSSLLAVAEGSKVGDLSDESLSARGHDLKYSQMYATVLHEIGHCITPGACTTGQLDPCTCNANQWEDELAGYSWLENGKNFTSPMVTWDSSKDVQRGKNECCVTLDSNYDDADKAYFAREYSDCIQEYSDPC